MLCNVVQIVVYICFLLFAVRTSHIVEEPIPPQYRTPQAYVDLIADTTELRDNPANKFNLEVPSEDFPNCFYTITRPKPTRVTLKHTMSGKSHTLECPAKASLYLHMNYSETRCTLRDRSTAWFRSCAEHFQGDLITKCDDLIIVSGISKKRRIALKREVAEGPSAQKPAGGMISVKKEKGSKVARTDPYRNAHADFQFPAGIAEPTAGA